MEKIYFYCILLILSLLSNLSKCNEDSIINRSISKLIGMVRMEIIDKSLLYLPKRKEVNILQMVKQMTEAKEKYSLNEVESAYLVFKWIAQNIIHNFYNEESDEPITVYNSGWGNPKGISSLFNHMCMFLNVVSDSISGYLKFADFRDYDIKFDKEYIWNYIEINGEYYLVDVSMVAEFTSTYWSDYIYAFFGTEPEIFFRMHFPNESKWQLLPEPYTFEKFKSMALLYPYFYLIGFKTIYPDTTKIIGSGEIILTSDKAIPELNVQFGWTKPGIDSDDLDWLDGPDGKIVIKYNVDKKKGLIQYLKLSPEYMNIVFPIVYYTTNYTYDASLDFDNKFQ